ncbi:MAG: flagellar biosynthetic protein FliR [Planctomycetota bacterium]|nr:flagellar biosynthetic protein FliR [Planctomycetota bacterium]
MVRKAWTMEFAASSMIAGYSQFLILASVLTRIGTVVCVAPMAGARTVPIPLRIAFTVAISLVVAPVYWQTAAIAEPNWSAIGIVLGAEVVIGLCMAFGLIVLFGSLELAGQMVGQVTGITLPGTAASNSEGPSQFTGRLLYLFGIAIFFTVGGHRILISGLLGTFQVLPPGVGRLPSDIVGMLTLMLSESFQLAIRIAAPTLLAVVGATILYGLISRAVPQLNVWSMGYGMNMLVLLAALSFSLGAIGYVLADEMPIYLENMLARF